MSEELMKKFQEHEKQIDAIVLAVVKHGETLEKIEEKIVTKEDISKLSNTLDELVGLAKKKDQELVFMSSRIDKVEKTVQKLQPAAGLA